MSDKYEAPWICELDGADGRVATSDVVVAWLSEAGAQSKGRLSVVFDCGPSKSWLRFLCAPTRELLPYFSVEWAGDYASLIFHDGAWSEYRALDTTNPVEPPEELRKQIAHGEPVAHPVDECMLKVRAFQAMRERIESGAKPEWLSYKYVP
jgi:hypothetical protein